MNSLANSIGYESEIKKAASNFRDHEGMSEDLITHWVSQFPNKNKPTAVKVLSNIIYFSAEEMRSMTNMLVGNILSLHKKVKPENIYFFPIGGVGSSAQLIARLIKDNNRINASNVLTLLDIEKIPADKIEVAVLFDDFSGTGNSIQEWWNTVEQLVLPKAKNITFGLLVLNHIALSQIKKISNDVVVKYSRLLKPKMNIFSHSCKSFTNAEKHIISDACKKTGCGPDYAFGYGKCGLLLAFKHCCPNNSLSILWCSSGRWRGIFKRKTI